MGIILCAKNGDLDGIIKCLAQGAKIDERDENGRTPLHWLANNGHTDLIKPLVTEHGADKNAVDEGNCTPLFLACLESNYPAAVALLDLGVDPNIQGRSPTTGQKATALLLAAEDAPYEVLKSFTTHYANVNVTLENLSTAMHLIAAREENLGLLPLLELMLQAGAEVSKDDLGFTPRDYLTKHDLSLGELFDALLIGAKGSI